MRHFPVSLHGDRGSFGLLSYEPPVAAVVFVHGFLGDPRTTWVDFEHLVERFPKWNRIDVYFYAYRSRNQIAPLAQEFGQFLASVARKKELDVIDSNFFSPSSPGRTLFEVPPLVREKRGPSPYRHLILVGHSTGAIVVREAIRRKIVELSASKQNLGAWANEETPLESLDYPDRMALQCSLRFFAPAHLGVLAAGKLGLARYLPAIRWLTNTYLGSNPLYQNLRCDSPTILNLKKATEDLWKKYKLQCLTATSLFGMNEEIVYIGGYAHDEEVPMISDHDHTSVCKPSADYTKPLEFVTYVSSTGKSA